MGVRIAKTAAAAAVSLLGGLHAMPAAAVTPGQADTFEAGSTDGWTSGAAHPAPPVADPAGFLRITALGTPGAGGRLVAFAGPQWAGDYVAAGVTGITLDVANLGSTDLELRLRLASGAGIVFTGAVNLAASSGWQQATFSLAPAALVGSDVALVLAGVTNLQLFHASGPLFPGPFVAASLGIDNVTAVPEPANAWLLLAGLAGIGCFGRRQRSLA